MPSQARREGHSGAPANGRMKRSPAAWAASALGGFCLILAILLLAACSSGGGSSTTVSPAASASPAVKLKLTPPVRVAGGQIRGFEGRSTAQDSSRRPVSV